MDKNALIVGATGIIGSAVAAVLTQEGWRVSGLARKPFNRSGVTPLAADLLDLSSLKVALAGTKPSHVFISSWLRQKTEQENIRVNAAMVRNLLEALQPAGSVRHVALVTGLKHSLRSSPEFRVGHCLSDPHVSSMTQVALPIGAMPPRLYHYALPLSHSDGRLDTQFGFLVSTAPLHYLDGLRKQPPRP